MISLRTLVLLVFVLFVTITCDDGGSDRGGTGDTDTDGDSDTDTDGDSDTDTDGDTDSDTDTDGTATGDCPPFPTSYAEAFGVFIDGGQSGRIVRYNAFKGLDHDHTGAEAIFDITLWENYGADLAPGKVDLADQSDYATCATCVLLHQEALLSDSKLTSAGHSFMPTAGTLEITQIQPTDGGVFSFTLDATLSEVVYDPGSATTTPVPDGCVIEVDGFKRTAVLVE